MFVFEGIGVIKSCPFNQICKCIAINLCNVEQETHQIIEAM